MGDRGGDGGGGEGGGEGLVRKDGKWDGVKVRCEMQLRRFGLEGEK